MTTYSIHLTLQYQTFPSYEICEHRNITLHATTCHMLFSFGVLSLLLITIKFHQNSWIPVSFSILFCISAFPSISFMLDQTYIVYNQRTAMIHDFHLSFDVQAHDDFGLVRKLCRKIQVANKIYQQVHRNSKNLKLLYT